MVQSRVVAKELNRGKDSLSLRDGLTPRLQSTKSSPAHAIERLVETGSGRTVAGVGGLHRRVYLRRIFADPTRAVASDVRAGNQRRAGYHRQPAQAPHHEP